MNLPHLPPRAAKPVIVPNVNAETPLPAAPLLRLQFDGSCRLNPGPMGIGYQLVDAKLSRVLVRVGAQIGEGTNNEAEYQALLGGLRHALRLGFWDLHIESDSQLVVNQVNGEWAVKDKGLARLHREALNILRLFESWSLAHIYRERNGAADELSRLMVFEEPELPTLPPAKTSRFPRNLYDWQAAAIRVWWLKHHPGAGTLSRIFGTPLAQIEQIGYGKTYKDATFVSYADYLTHLNLPAGNPGEPVIRSMI